MKYSCKMSCHPLIRATYEHYNDLITLTKHLFIYTLYVFKLLIK